MDKIDQAIKRIQLEPKQLAHLQMLQRQVLIAQAQIEIAQANANSFMAYLMLEHEFGPEDSVELATGRVVKAAPSDGKADDR